VRTQRACGSGRRCAFEIDTTGKLQCASKVPQFLLSTHPATINSAFLGRIAPEKRVDLAIHIAEHCGVPLKIAAKVNKADQDYFKQQIKPWCDQFQLTTDFRARRELLRRMRSIRSNRKGLQIRR
jgi:hypothetical protein